MNSVRVSVVLVISRTERPTKMARGEHKLKTLSSEPSKTNKKKVDIAKAIQSFHTYALHFSQREREDFKTLQRQAMCTLEENEGM